MNKALPASFEYMGRTYWMRCSIGVALLEVFDTPATSEPLISAFCGSSDEHGHHPAH